MSNRGTHEVSPGPFSGSPEEEIAEKRARESAEAEKKAYVETKAYVKANTYVEAKAYVEA